jgi:hypothetical protein
MLTGQEAMVFPFVRPQHTPASLLDVVDQNSIDAHINAEAFADKALDIFDTWRAQDLINV